MTPVGETAFFRSHPLHMDGTDALRFVKQKNSHVR
jgi:hypothetical protein